MMFNKKCISWYLSTALCSQTRCSKGAFFIWLDGCWATCPTTISRLCHILETCKKLDDTTYHVKISCWSYHEEKLHCLRLCSFYWMHRWKDTGANTNFVWAVRQPILPYKHISNRLAGKHTYHWSVDDKHDLIAKEAHNKLLHTCAMVTGNTF